MEDDFAALYRGLIARVGPDPCRLHQGLLALFPPDGAQTAEKPLQSAEKCDIESENDTKHRETRENGE